MDSHNCREKEQENRDHSNNDNNCNDEDSMDSHNCREKERENVDSDNNNYNNNNNNHNNHNNHSNHNNIMVEEDIDIDECRGNAKYICDVCGTACHDEHSFVFHHYEHMTAKEKANLVAGFLSCNPK